MIKNKMRKNEIVNDVYTFCYTNIKEQHKDALANV